MANRTPMAPCLVSMSEGLLVVFRSGGTPRRSDIDEEVRRPR
jgi:hypothetical protein